MGEQVCHQLSGTILPHDIYYLQEEKMTSLQASLHIFVIHVLTFCTCVPSIPCSQKAHDRPLYITGSPKCRWPAHRLQEQSFKMQIAADSQGSSSMFK